MTAKHYESETINWLMYHSYEFNRDRSPDINPERWRKIYFNAETYEKIYQEKKQPWINQINLKN